MIFLLLLLGDGHVIRVVDDASGRGVPLIELETTHKLKLVTDSAGVAVFDEPGLLGREIWLHVRGDGYEHAADGFGFRGLRIKMEPKGRTTIKVKRLLPAERLYRLTGQGIYAETIKAGDVPPIREANGGVFGQDSVQTIAWKGKLWWFWGDTERGTYPLGQFGTSGATSPLPDPEKGVELTYWVDDQGFSRRMIEVPEPEGPVWIDALMLARDPEGVERLLAHYIVVKTLGDVRRRGICAWNEKTERFEPLALFDVHSKLHPRGQPVQDGGYYYFPAPFATVRVKADWASILDPKSYEGFNGAWAKGAAPSDVAPLRSRDGEKVVAHMGTVCRNAHRKKWVSIFHQKGGKPSLLGEVWYAEAERPWGPFERAVKIATHAKYSFYNVAQHPEFDQGSRIYFEGTYTSMFTDVQTPTPRYDYNQILYRLDLDDPRLDWAKGEK